MIDALQKQCDAILEKAQLAKAAKEKAEQSDDEDEEDGEDDELMAPPKNKENVEKSEDVKDPLHDEFYSANPVPEQMAEIDAARDVKQS